MSKYGNRRITIGKETFDSEKECRRYMELLFMVRAGVITDLQRQVPFTLVDGFINPVDRKKERAIVYVADFVYLDHDGKTHVEDVKGCRKADDPAYRIFRMKQKMLYQRHGIWIEVV